MKTALSFDDVLLVPQGSDIESRKEVDISSALDQRLFFDKDYKKLELKFDIPIISSPMDTVTEYDMVKTIGSLGGLGIIHRYNSIEEQITQVKLCNNSVVGCAIGVKNDFQERAKELYKEGVRIFCIDVAHGFHSLVRKTIEYLKNTFGENIHIMAGNIATSQACECLANWGADSVRIGIGGGSVCETRGMTGHGVPTFQSIKDCKENWSSAKGKNIIKIADGGIRNSGDIVKALAAGADFVMLGSLLAGTLQSPGKIIEEKEDEQVKYYKNYRGMASADAQKDWSGKVNSEEGISVKIPYKGSVTDIIHSLEKGIRSGLSYSGARTIKELQAIREFVFQTTAGSVESSTHILKTGKKM